MPENAIRLNVARSHPLNSAKSALLKHLIRMFAQEYDVVEAAVKAHLSSGSPQFGEEFVKFFVNQGWRMQWYALPVPDNRLNPNEDNVAYCAISTGVLIDNQCEHLVAWHLSRT